MMTRRRARPGIRLLPGRAAGPRAGGRSLAAAGPRTPRPPLLLASSSTSSSRRARRRKGSAGIIPGSPRPSCSSPRSTADTAATRPPPPSRVRLTSRCSRRPTGLSCCRAWSQSRQISRAGPRRRLRAMAAIERRWWQQQQQQRRRWRGWCGPRRCVCARCGSSSPCRSALQHRLRLLLLLPGRCWLTWNRPPPRWTQWQQQQRRAAATSPTCWQWRQQRRR